MTLFLLHLGSCLFLTGLIWLVQIVHYPSFAYVDAAQFESFNIFHQKSITSIVAPMMIFELASGAYLAALFSQDWRFLALFGLILMVWAFTFFLSVPLHSELLSRGFLPDVIDRLVLTNWPRTILWTLRSVFLLYLFRVVSFV